MLADNAVVTDMEVNKTDIYITGYKTNVKNDSGTKNDHACYWKNGRINMLDVNFINTGLK